MVTLICGMFNQALKTNDNLQFAVLTGCLRVAKESIFTGLNNPKVFSVTSVRFDEYFGFTDREVREMLGYYGLDNRYDSVRDWYDGYRFGNVDVYCPWDVINFCDDLTDEPDMEPRDYWSNTSGNDIVRYFMEKVDKGLTRGEIEALVAGETVTKEVREELAYDNLYETAGEPLERAVHDRVSDHARETGWKTRGAGYSQHGDPEYIHGADHVHVQRGGGEGRKEAGGILRGAEGRKGGRGGEIA